MEADWEFEIAPAAPVIDAAWDGLVDLRAAPGRIREIAETALLPGLADVLIRLNGPASTAWTSKCDVWIPEAFDPDELDAPADLSTCAMACYIDVLPRASSGWDAPAAVEAFCRSACSGLRAFPARCCRVDLVVRRAVVQEGREGLGITVYLVGCGECADSARAALACALTAFADSVCTPAQAPSASKSLQ